jgi:hypothetical protein
VIYRHRYDPSAEGVEGGCSVADVDDTEAAGDKHVSKLLADQVDTVGHEDRSAPKIQTDRRRFVAFWRRSVRHMTLVFRHRLSPRVGGLTRPAAD